MGIYQKGKKYNRIKYGSKPIKHNQITVDEYILRLKKQADKLRILELNSKDNCTCDLHIDHKECYNCGYEIA